MAPVDIINILERAKQTAKFNRDELLAGKSNAASSPLYFYFDGKIDQCKELIAELEGFKKLFS